jgi:glyoxalase family protein
VHHIPCRASDDRALLSWRGEIREVPLDVTLVLDRTYFDSIYFREPGGVFFEIATDPLGLATMNLLRLWGVAEPPPWLESRRSAIEKILPSISLHYQRFRMVIGSSWHRVHPSRTHALS